MTRHLLLGFGALVVAAAAIAAGPGGDDPFAFFAPSVRVTPAERASLDAGDVMARVLPADDGHIAFFAASRLNATPDALIEWTRAIDELKRGPLVLAVGRFSEPAADDDLRGLMLDKDEIESLKRCKPGSCDFKLAASEIAAVQDARRAAGADWRDAVQAEFRRILLARVRLHRDRGLLALPPYVDRAGISVAEAFSAMTARSPYLTSAAPDLINSLVTPRRERRLQANGFYYWSRERYGVGKTVVSVTYVQTRTQHLAPQAITVSAQLYASHYVDGALGVSAVLCDERLSTCYLAYLNRTRVDLLGGLFGGFKRAVIEDRIESDAPKLLREVIRRLESGAPRREGGES
jgi:hypothetical protein